MKRIVTLLLVLSLATAALAGCGGTQTTKNTGAIEKTTPDSYPIKTEETLTYWMVASGHVTAVYPSLNETPHAAALKEQTGIGVKFIHPVVGQENEQFNLMISSGELPDIIEYPFYEYPGGPQKAVQDGCIITLNEVLNVTVKNGVITLTKAFTHRTLEERAAEYNGNLNLEGEFDWGEPLGREVW